jgi:probable rRNA maturation factor
VTAPLCIEITADAPQWARTLPTAETLVRQAVSAAWRAAGTGQKQTEISIVLGDDALVRRLNGEYRDQDQATNVLSFPGGDRTGPGPHLLGDVILAYGTIAREAGEQNKTLDGHLLHLCVHGVLHLLGHDHQKDADAAAMEALETDILAELGIDDPYSDAALEQLA